MQIPAFLLIGQSNAVNLAPYLQAEITDIFGLGAPLLNAAVNGSSIASWQPGQPNYNAAVTLAKDAIDSGFKLKAVLMSHGESDAHLPSAKMYGTDCNYMLDSLRADIQQHVPMIYTQLGKKPVTPPGYAFDFWDVLRYQQLTMRFNRPGFFMIDRSQIDIYADADPYCHDTGPALGLIAREYGRYLEGWIK